MELFAADGHDAGGCERVTGKSGMRPHHVSSGPGRRRSHAEPPRDRGGAREALVQRCVPGLEHAAAAVRQSGRPPGDGYGHRYRWAVGGGLPRRGDRRKESDPIRDAIPRGGSGRPRVRAAGCPSVSAVGGVVACNAAGARRWSVPSRTRFKWTSTPLVGRRRAAPMGPSTGCVLLTAVGVVRRLGHKGVDLELLLAVVRVRHVQLFPVSAKSAKNCAGRLSTATRPFSSTLRTTRTAIGLRVLLHDDSRQGYPPLVAVIILNVERTTDDPVNGPAIVSTVAPTCENMAADRKVALDYLRLAEEADISIFEHDTIAESAFLDGGADKMGIYRCVWPVVNEYGITHLDLKNHFRSHDHGGLAGSVFCLWGFTRSCAARTVLHERSDHSHEFFIGNFRRPTSQTQDERLGNIAKHLLRGKASLAVDRPKNPLSAGIWLFSTETFHDGRHRIYR